MYRTMMAITAAFLTAPALGAQSPSERGGFVLVASSDTVVVERFTESNDTLSGILSIAGGPRFVYVAKLRADGLVSTISMNVFGPNAAPEAEPIQRVTITMIDDSVLIESATKSQKFGTVAGALPLLNNSFALIELATRKASTTTDSTDIPLFSLNGAVTLPMAIRPINADSVTLTVAGQAHRLHVDGNGRILGGAVPSQHLMIYRVDGASTAKLALGKPDYSPPAGAPYTATDVTLTGPDGIILGGTLTVPIGAKGPVPAVVTITGSGQQDRDEYMPVAGGYRPFRQVADTLGRRGIAVLRLDDRMIGASGGKAGTSADYADDIRAALAFLRTRPEIDGDRLALVGHSEGGLIAPLVAATDPKLKGAVLMAGPSQTGAEILRYQQHNAIDHEPRIEPGSRDSAYAATELTLDSLTAKDPWLDFFVKYDPLVTARKVKTPVLILQGGTDHQITPEQAPALGKAIESNGNSDVTVRVFPGLNHLFLPDSSGQPSGYRTLINNKVDPAVLGTMADWLVKRLGVD